MKVEANKTYIGVVEDNNDPKKLGRVKVRVLDVYDNLKVEDIPFAAPWKDLNGNEFNVPEKGKVLVVVFDQGDEHKPEYIAADHYNINLEKKLQSLSNTDYISMKSLIFDHKTQIYVNDSEGLKIDYKYNNVNITESTIDLNLKDNNRHVNIGDATAGQQAILGNHWMDWFDEFVDNLMGNNGGPYLGNLGAPVVANPALIQVLMKYKALRDPVFLSHHVNIVDNNKVSTVKNTKREDTAQVGDNWTSTKQENNLTAKTNENFKPVDGPKPEYNDKHVEQPLVAQPNTPTTANVIGTASGTASATIVENKQPVANSADANPPAEPASSPLSNPKIDKMINFMKSKGYKVYDAPNVLNMVAFMNTKKDKGEVSNKFDDILNVFYKNSNNNWELLEYQLTTMPGWVPKTELLPEKVGFLQFGQYIDQLKFSEYNGYKALNVSECIVHINDSVQIYNFKSQTTTTKNICLLHKSDDKGSAESVFNYSGGAHVFKNAVQYDQFIKLCEEQFTSSKKDTYTYTFCKNSEFEEFIPEVETTTQPKVESTTSTVDIANWEPGKLISKDLYVDYNIKVEYVITMDSKPGSYSATLTSTKDRDIKSETYTSSNLDSLKKLLKEEAEKDFNQLKVERG